MQVKELCNWFYITTCEYILYASLQLHAWCVCFFTHWYAWNSLLQNVFCLADFHGSPVRGMNVLCQEVKPLYW